MGEGLCDLYRSGSQITSPGVVGSTQPSESTRKFGGMLVWACRVVFLNVGLFLDEQSQSPIADPPPPLGPPGSPPAPPPFPSGVFGQQLGGGSASKTEGSPPPQGLALVFIPTGGGPLPPGHPPPLPWTPSPPPPPAQASPCPPPPPRCYKAVTGRGEISWDVQNWGL